jgi:hypothetical protein
MSEGPVGNGLEGDVREIRAEVTKIGKEGCGHKEGHDQAIRDLWKAVGNEKMLRENAIEAEKKAREATFVKTILMVVGIVLATALGSMWATSTVVERAINKTLVTHAEKSLR